jgi:hypothetical protein
MRILTARHSNVSVQINLKRTALGTCRLFLSDRERFSEVNFCDPTTPRILQTISDEVSAFQVNRILFKECSAALLYSEPYLAWYAGVLGHVYSDSENLQFPVHFSERNRSFALQVLAAEPEHGYAGVHLTLLLPPLWHSSLSNSAVAGTDEMPDFSHKALPAGLCLLRPIGCGRWTGKLLQGEQEDGFRRLFSPEAVL